MRFDASQFTPEFSFKNRCAATAARFCLRSSMWFATVYWRNQKRGIGAACMRAISVHAVGAVLMCARAVGLLVALLEYSEQHTLRQGTVDVPLLRESAASQGKT